MSAPLPVAAVRALRGFIGSAQLEVMGAACRGPEREWFKAKFCELANIVAAMPHTYGQDGKGSEAVAFLHYFTPSADFYITEKDAGSPDDEKNGVPAQSQAFGLADLFGDGGEIGYISLPEILEAGAELDLHWSPKTLAECRKARSTPAASCPGYAGPAPEGVDYSEWLAINNID